MQKFLSLQSVPTKVSQTPILPPFSIGLTGNWVTFTDHSGRGGDCLLALREIFRDQCLTRVIGRFQAILPALEKHHYLLAYRLRFWLSSQFFIQISDPLERTSSQTFPLPHPPFSFDALKRSFFENASEIIPMSDIRIQVLATRPKS